MENNNITSDSGIKSRKAFSNKEYKKCIKKVITILLTIIIPLCLTISGIKNPRMRIDVIEEDVVFDSTPYTFFNYDSLKQKHEPIEKTLFSMDAFFTQASVITIKIRNDGKEAIGSQSYNQNAPITICFENSELVCKPYIWSEICTVPINQLKVQYPNTVILPSTILNHNDSYYFKVLLVTVSHKIPKIIVKGQIFNQKKIKVRISKNVNFFNENKIIPISLPEAKYLRNQNWEECITIQNQISAKY